MTIANRAAALLACVLLLVLAGATAIAQDVLPITGEQAEQTNEPAAPVIEVERDRGDDQQLKARIEGIFREIPRLGGVRVRVSEGVVTLDGTVPESAAIGQAEAIANRVSGVATVQNNLERDLEVGRNIDPALSGAAAQLRSLYRALPLIGIAFALAVAVIAIGYLLARQRRLWLWLAPNSFLAELMATAVRFVAIIGGIVLALRFLDATALLGAVLGGAGVLGIAIGFAVRDSIDNYISSLLLSIRQPFRANDVVRIGEHEGRVLRLNSRATILLTFDGNHLRIPNATVFKATIINYTRNPKRRITVKVTIDHNADPCAARAAGVGALRDLPFILEEPSPFAEVVELNGVTQILQFHGWIDQDETDFIKARTLVIEMVRSALRSAGFILPDTRYVVRLDRDGTEAQRDTRARSKSKPVEREDVAPQDSVADMVAEERSHDDAQDLLDRQQPEE